MPVLEFAKEAPSGLRSEQTDQEEHDNRNKNPKLHEAMPETFLACPTFLRVFSHRWRQKSGGFCPAREDTLFADLLSASAPLLLPTKPPVTACGTALRRWRRRGWWCSRRRRFARRW